MAKENVNKLIDNINQISRTADGDFAKNQKAAYELLLASRRLNFALEPPAEMAMGSAFSGIYLTCIRLAIELRLFEKISSSAKPLTIEDLVADGSSDEALLRSIIRVLVAKDFVGETKTAKGGNAYTPTAMTYHMNRPSVRAGLIFHYDSGLPLLSQALSYFRSTNFRLPQGHSPGLFQYAFNTADNDYMYWSKQPGVMENFSVFMQGYFGGDVQPTPIEWFPFDEVCFKGLDSQNSKYAYVDVGGGKGQNLQAIVEKYGSSVQGAKWMLQDLPSVIEDIEKSGMVLDERIERMAYSYFEPQPICGAKTYLLENVFHNHNDDVSKEVLAVLKDTLEPGYSKLLISSVILPDQAAPFAVCGLDFMLSCCNGGRERTARDWTNLLEACGFKIVKFWYPPGAGNGVIEAELAHES